MNRFLRVLLALLVALATACNLPNAPGAQGPQDASGQNPWNAYPFFDKMSVQCGTAMINVPMTHAVRARGEKTPPMHKDLRAKGIALPPRQEERTNVELFAGARKRARKFAVAVAGSQASVVGAAGTEADEIRRRVDGLLAWRDAALHASQHCHAMALHGAFVVELETMYGQNKADVAVERAAAKRVIAQRKRADAWAASALALVALYQGAATGGDATLLDKTATVVVDDFNAPLGPVSEQEVSALFEAGRQKAIQIDAWSRTWGPSVGVHDEHQRRQLLGLDDRGGGSGASGGDGGGIALEGDSKEIFDALMGLARGDAAAIIRGAAILFPKDSPVRLGLTGVGAIAQGDVVTALRVAGAMAPKDSRIGAVLATTNQVLAVAKVAGG